MKLILQHGPLDGQHLEFQPVTTERITQIIVMLDHETPVLYECDESLEEEQQHPQDNRVLFYNPDEHAVFETIEFLL